MNKAKPFILLLLAGFFYTLGFPNLLTILIPFMPIVATAILLFLLFQAETTRKRILYYLFYNSVINLLSFYWVTNTLQEFGNLPFIVAALMNTLYALILNPHYFVLIFILHWSAKYPKVKATFFKNGLFNVVIAILLSFFEYFIPQQFPIMLGQPWIVLSKYLGAASLFGLPIFSFMSYLLAMEITRAFKVKRLSNINLFSILIFVVVNPFLVEIPSRTQEFITYNVRLVQANISNFMKVDSEGGGYASTAQVLNQYKILTEKKFTIAKKLNLTVWPETAYPYPINTSANNLLATPIPSSMVDLVFKTGAPLLFGGYDHFKESNNNNSFYQTEHNASLYLNNLAQLEQIYHKHILIPFGETLPLGPLNEWASTLLPEMAFFAVGTSFPLFETESGINFISSICYEILRPELMREYLNKISKRPHLMINLTNDSWYGNTVEPEQHLFLTRWRAIEFDLPILRSTNTGISTYINNRGEETKRLDYGETGNLDLSLQLPKIAHQPTLFQKFGFWGLFPIWFLYFLFHVMLIKLKYD